MTHNCQVCGDALVVDENCTQYRIDTSQYRCRRCHAEYQIERAHRIGLCQPMSENRSCSLFLGVHVAERVLSHVFKNVERKSNNNGGFDFICGRGHKIDVKSACRRHRIKHADHWSFHIRNNRIADYFLCLAFDNRDDLNPEHIWIIPGGEVNDHSVAVITETTISKWAKYALDVDKVSACCNVLRDE